MNARVAAAVALVRFALALAVAGALAALYRAAGGGVGDPPWWAVVLAAVLVALVLARTREAVRRRTARAVLGAGADGYELLRGLLHDIGSTVPVDDVVPRIAETAGRSVGRGPARVRLLLPDGDETAYPAAGDALPGGPPPPSGDASGLPLTVDVRHAGRPVGEIAVDVRADSVPPVNRRLLDELAGPAGLAMSTVGLTLALRRRAAELTEVNLALERSTARVREARRLEQRRLRDTVAARVTPHIEAAHQLLVAGDRPDLPVAALQTGLAVDELRTVAHGIFPPRLHEDGVLASLEGWIARSAVPVSVASSGEEDLVNHADVAACLYFCAVTALDAFSAAGATGLRVVLDVRQERAVLTVAGDAAAAQDAITVIGDRAEAFDGSLTTTDRHTLTIDVATGTP